MTMLKRDDLVKSLAAVDAGLSARGIIEQFSCYVFQGGRIWTFNDDVVCSAGLPSAMEKMECAVPAVELRSLLTKLDDENIDVSLGDGKSIAEGQLVLKTKNRRAGLRVQMQIALPVGEISLPDTWKKIPDGLLEAVETVQGCASKDASISILSCLRFTPGGIEACDNYQAIRYRMKTGLEEPVLVKRDELVKITKLDVEEWSVADSWFHFRNAAGLVASCRRCNERYPNLTPFFDVEGQETSLPKSLIEAANKAEVFVDSKYLAGLVVDLNSSRLLLRGEGPLGWYEERQKTDYAGEPLRFRVAPRLLREVCSRSEQCVIGHDKLCVHGDRFVYMSCLIVDEEKEE